ncbi:MAG: hypothetical protein P9M14_04140 [Candidatus Alcyoniella australis]|nr:hypothetical protein [Candidatus Alcyoniella australis]
MNWFDEDDDAANENDSSDDDDSPDDDDSADDDSSDDDDDDDDDYGELIFSEDWERHESGSPPGEPWQVYDNGGTAQAKIVYSRTGWGKSLQLDADVPSDITAVSPWAVGGLTSGTISAEFDAVLDQGDNLGVVLIGEGSLNQVYAIVIAGQVVTIDGEESVVVCGSHDPGSWVHVLIQARIGSQTHSVTVNGQSGQCSDLGWVNAGVGSGELGSMGIFIDQYRAGTGRVDNILVYYGE